MKHLWKVVAMLVVLAVVWAVGESLLQPRVRVVPLEGVPVTAGAPDVTFMIGANMDPQISTNPFLVVFSPIERLTDKTRVLPGNLHAVSDTEAVFVWDAFGVRTLWHLDRHSQELSSLSIRDTQATHLCSRLFPTTAAFWSGRGEQAPADTKPRL